MTDKTRVVELKPCPSPWCNSHKTEDVEIRAAEAPILMPSRSSLEWSVACPACPLQTPWRDTAAEAIAAWNTRTPTPTSGEASGASPLSERLYLAGAGHAPGSATGNASDAPERDAIEEAGELREALEPFAKAAEAGKIAYDIVKSAATELQTYGATPLAHPQIGIAVSIAQDKVSWADWDRARRALSLRRPDEEKAS